MITLVTGLDGSGKSNEMDRLIVNDMDGQKNVMLIVPEHQSVSTESRITKKAIDRGVPLYRLVVTSFSNLANTVFRTYGGVCYNYIGRGAKKIILWKALESVKASLKIYKNVSVSDSSVLTLILGAIETMGIFDVSPEELLSASDEIGQDGGTVLSEKAAELSLIAGAYKNILHDEYDDPSEDLPRLRDMLDRHNFFSGYSVYIDSFESLTKVRLDIVSRIMRQADSLYITLPIELDTYKRYGNVYKSVYDTYAKLRSEIKSTGLEFGEKSVKPSFSDAPANFILAENMWDMEKDGPVSPDEPENIGIITCRDIFAQAEAVAGEIMKSVMNGDRFADSLIITRDIKKYVGVIDSVFEKYGIPCFVSRRKDLINRSISRLIVSASNVICRDFSTEDVISYMKTGLAGITYEDADLIEDYVSLKGLDQRRRLGNESGRLFRVVQRETDGKTRKNKRNKAENLGAASESEGKSQRYHNRERNRRSLLRVFRRNGSEKNSRGKRGRRKRVERGS